MERQQKNECKVSLDLLISSKMSDEKVKADLYRIALPAQKRVEKIS